MVKIIGVLKWMVSLAGVVLIIMTMFNVKTNHLAEKLAAIMIIVIIGGIYLYYLIKTGSWNMKGSNYSANLSLMVGLCLHFAFQGTLLYYAFTKMPVAVMATTALTCAIAIAIGVHDARQLIKSRAKKAIS